MNEKSYNMYLKMIKLACRNVRSAVCMENGIEEKDSVQVKVRDRDGLVNMVSEIVQSPDTAEALFSSRVAKRVVVVSDSDLPHAVDAASVFIQSILKSRIARACQKQLTEYLTAERYLDAAWDYDEQHDSDKKPSVAFAKDVLIKRYSLNFIGGFVFDGRPHIEPNILSNLRAQAFDMNYSFLTEEQNARMADAKYMRDFESRHDKFLSSSPQAFTQAGAPGAEQKSMIDVFIRRAKKSETDIIAQLYQSSFADVPLQKRRRRFVNLKSKNRDAEICPVKMLAAKRQFSQIEATTKHAYIMAYLNDNMPEGADRKEYYFEQEAWMYRYIWQMPEGDIYVQAGSICLPDNRAVAVPDMMDPYEFLHRINTVYAALFGFTKDDVAGGSKWLIDSIRRAYTDEGNALYRLTVIDGRLGEDKKKARKKLL